MIIFKFKLKKTNFYKIYFLYILKKNLRGRLSRLQRRLIGKPHKEIQTRFRLYKIHRPHVVAVVSPPRGVLVEVERRHLKISAALDGDDLPVPGWNAVVFVRTWKLRHWPFVKRTSQYEDILALCEAAHCPL